MLEGTKSACINHPGVEATVRCKQCGRPVCDACVVTGPTGRFCSQPCKQKHEAFYQKAQGMDGKARSSFFIKLKGLLSGVIILVAVLAAVGVVATVVEIPLLSDLTRQVRALIGI